MSVNLPEPTDQRETVPTLEQLMGDLASVVITSSDVKDEALANLATQVAQSVHRDAARYRKMREWVRTANIEGDRCFIVDVDWGDVPCSEDTDSDARMLDEAIDREP